MFRFIAQRRDFFAGGLMMLIGLVAIMEGRNYNLGTLRQMGPGFFPIALGVLLVFLGILIVATSAASNPADDPTVARAPEWRGWFCILAGPVLFIVFGKYGGMIPAIFVCVFVSALGDRTATLKTSAILAAAVTVFGVLLFSYLLKVPMPLWKLGSP